MVADPKPVDERLCRWVRWIRLVVFAGIAVVGWSIDDSATGRHYWTCVALAGVFLLAGRRHGWEAHADRLVVAFPVVLVLALLLRGPLPWWVPVLVLVVLGPLPYLAGALVLGVYEVFVEDDDGMSLWAVYAFETPTIRKVVVLGGWLSIGLVTSGIGATLLLTPAAVSTAIGHPFIAGVVLAITYGFTGPTVPWLTVAGMTLVVVIGRLPPGVPRHDPGLPVDAHLRWRPAARARIWRLDRQLRRGRWERALELADRLEERSGSGSVPLSSSAALRSAFMHLEMDAVQDALDDATAASASTDARVRLWAQVQRSEAMTASNQAEEALRTVDGLPADELVGDDLCAAVALARARALLALGQNAEAATEAERAVGLNGGWRHRFDRVRPRLVLAMARWRADDPDGAKEALDSWGDLLSSRWYRRQFDDSLSSTEVATRQWSLVLREMARGAVLLERIDLDPRLGQGAPDEETLSNLDQASELLNLLGLRMDRAELDLVRAQILGSKRAPRKALDLAISALADLDLIRHSLRSPASRSAWSDHFFEGLELALGFSHACGRSVLIAELLELARVQARPQLGGSQEDELALHAPPTVRVRGRAHIVRGPSEVSRTAVDIEAAAASAAGPGAWWMSSWQDANGYWTALVPPGGRVTHELMNAADRSELERLLEQLRQCLPMELDDESPGDFDMRLATSALLVDPVDEADLAGALGRLLLPELLRAELIRRHRAGEPPLRLAIAPAPEMGFVPWSVLGVERLEAEGADLRFVELAEWVLAPSATLIASASRVQAPEGPLPLRLVVLDPSESAPLPSARATAGLLGDDVSILGGRSWTDRPATPAAVLEELSTVGRSTTVMFGCHAAVGDVRRPSSAALVLASDGPTDVLTAADLLASGIDPAAFPAQVSLQACDTSDLAAAGSGEWLGLAPAFVAAGASAVLTTQFPLIDAPVDPDDELLVGMRAGRDLLETIRSLQIAALGRWREHVDRGAPPRSLSDAPMIWGAYAVCAAGRSPYPTDQAPGVAGSVRLRSALGAAAQWAQDTHRSTVTSAHFAAGYVGDETELVDEGFATLVLVGGALWVLPRVLRAAPIPGATSDELVPSAELVGLLRDAARSARSSGVDIEPEHVLEAALTTRGSAAGKLLRLTRLDHHVGFRRTMQMNLRNAQTQSDRGSAWSAGDGATHLGFIRSAFTAADLADFSALRPVGRMRQ